MQEHAAVPQWDMKVLRELAQINYGRDARPILDPYGAYPVYGTAENNRCGTSYLYDGDSVVLGRKGTIDRVQFVTGPFWTIDTAYFLSNFLECEPKWLYYVLSGVDLRSLNEATGVPSLAREVLYRLPVLTPSPPEQSKIAEVLSTVDRAIAQTEALIAKQQRIKTGLMQDLLTRGIDEHGQLRSEATHAFKDSPLGRIPVEWEVKPLGEIVDESITYGIVQAGPNIEGGVPYIRTGDMRDDEIHVERLLKTSQQVAKSYKRSAVSVGDIVFALRASVGKVLPVTVELDGANLTQGTAKISPNESTDSDFLLWAIRTSQVQGRIRLEQKGTTFMEITLGDLRAVRLAMPKNKIEQSLIAKMLEVYNRAWRNDVKQRAKLMLLKAALMQDLLTGKVRVTPLLPPAEAAHA